MSPHCVTFTGVLCVHEKHHIFGVIGDIDKLILCLLPRLWIIWGLLWHQQGQAAHFETVNIVTHHPIACHHRHVSCIYRYVPFTCVFRLWCLFLIDTFLEMTQWKNQKNQQTICFIMFRRHFAICWMSVYHVQRRTPRPFNKKWYDLSLILADNKCMTFY